MSAGLYGEADLVAAYDAINPMGAEAAFLLSVVGDAPQRILDLGCGTGRLAMRLAEMGHAVTGLEPAGLMLDRARARPGAGRVSWLHTDAASLDVAARFDLVLMAGHVFQVLLDDVQASAVLRGVARHLAEGGRVILASRNPAIREWESWTPEHGAEICWTPELGRFEVCWDLVEVQGPLVTYATCLRFADSSRHRGIDTIRFRERSEIAQLLKTTGLREVATYGDWNHSGWTASSPEIVVVAEALPDPGA